ncbi:MAG: hypothetical protein IJ796_01940 [Lachnospiraceae bacterium]|nr:hypothetical protein [Lachnospiraceae bacterium]
MSKTENNINERLEGVFPSKRKDGTPFYRSSLTYKNKHISLGSYDTPQQAHQAYRMGRLLLAATYTKLEDYTEGNPLSFEKWVVLLNFRDNDIYIGTPIYVGTKMFSYYLSPDKVLKFDMDDLFYFSSHKIMQRGGHLFVSDYGSQITLYTRFGIRPYAVEGVDYKFVNGDKSDFRRQNLKVVNSYHGVRPGARGNFHARIHLNGYFHIGTYETALEAAIAYNKAVDIVRKAGCKKNFLQNYVEEITPRQYAELYFKLPLSDNILNFKA